MIAPGKIRLVIEIPELLRRRFKAACVSQGLEMSEVLREYIQKFISEAEAKK